MAEFKRTALGYGYQRYEGYGYLIEDEWKRTCDDIWGRHYVEHRCWKVTSADGSCRASFNSLNDAKKWCRENSR